MAIKKRVTKKKSSIGSYVKKLQAAPAVKRATKSIKDLEKKIMAAKKKKAAAVKIARKKLSKSYKNC